MTRDERRAIRCCGRFAFWRLPLGPWCCTKCPRTFDGPMPRSAVPRFWDHVENLAARIPEWTAAQRAFVERTFRAVLVDAEKGPPA